MSLRRLSFAALALLVLALAVAPAPVRASNANLLAAVAAVQGLDQQDVRSLKNWASSGAFPPIFGNTPVQRVEQRIANLGSNDRWAILNWIQGNGRGSLYSRGLTDAQIGPGVPGIDFGANPPPRPTPQPYSDYRTIPLTADPNQAPGSGITIRSGFAAVRKDGRAAIVCVSFTNDAPKVANAIVFRYAFGASDAPPFAITKNRTGTFSPNINIDGASGLVPYANATPRTLRDNCLDYAPGGLANLALLHATYAAASVTSVGYDDGTMWPTALPQAR